MNEYIWRPTVNLRHELSDAAPPFCLCVFVYVGVCAHECRRPEEAVKSSGAGVESSPIWVLGTQFMSSARSIHTLTTEQSLQAPPRFLRWSISLTWDLTDG